MGKPKIVAADQGNRPKHRGNSQVNKFQKLYGNARDGQGFASLRARRIAARFNKRKFKKKKKEESVGDDSSQAVPGSTENVDAPPRHAHTKVPSNSTSTSHVSTAVDGAVKKKKRSKHLKRIEVDYELLQAEREKKFKELLEKRRKHEELVLKSIAKRKKLTERLNKRTAKGQPIMANRIELLLSKLKPSAKS